MTSLQTVVLTDPASSLTATFVPGAGMICTSLSNGGVELLGQRRGLQSVCVGWQDNGHSVSVSLG